MTSTNGDHFALVSSTPTSSELVETDILTEMMDSLSIPASMPRFPINFPDASQSSRDSTTDGIRARPAVPSLPRNTITVSSSSFDVKDSFNPEHQRVSTPVVMPSRNLETQHPVTNLVPSISATATSMSAHSRSDVRLIILDKFTLFRKLPAELRLRVWKEVYAKPRLIEMCAEDYTTNWWAEPDLDYSALATVCHESRADILKTHLFLGKKKNEKQKSTSKCHRRILFDGAKDTIVFRRDKFLRCMGLSTWTKQVSLVILKNIRPIVWEGKQEFYHLPAENLSLNSLVQCVGDRNAIASMSTLKTVHFSHFEGRERLVLLRGMQEGDSEESLKQLRLRIGDATAILIRRATGGGIALHAGQFGPQNNDSKVEFRLGKLLIAD